MSRYKNLHPWLGCLLTICLSINTIRAIPAEDRGVPGGRDSACINFQSQAIVPAMLFQRIHSYAQEKTFRWLQTAAQWRRLNEVLTSPYARGLIGLITFGIGVHHKSVSTVLAGMTVAGIHLPDPAERNQKEGWISPRFALQFSRHFRYITMYGLPGIGKGKFLDTFVREVNYHLTSDHQYAVITTGDILRETLRVVAAFLANPQQMSPEKQRFLILAQHISQSDLDAIRDGRLISNTGMTHILSEILKWPQYQKAYGIFFDGYPRNAAQFKDLERGQFDAIRKIRLDLIIVPELQGIDEKTLYALRIKPRGRPTEDWPTMMRRFEEYHKASSDPYMASLLSSEKTIHYPGVTGSDAEAGAQPFNKEKWRIISARFLERITPRLEQLEAQQDPSLTKSFMRELAMAATMVVDQLPTRRALDYATHLHSIRSRVGTLASKIEDWQYAHESIQAAVATLYAVCCVTGEVTIDTMNAIIQKAEELSAAIYKIAHEEYYQKRFPLIPLPEEVLRGLAHRGLSRVQAFRTADVWADPLEEYHSRTALYDRLIAEHHIPAERAAHFAFLTSPAHAHYRAMEVVALWLDGLWEPGESPIAILMETPPAVLEARILKAGFSPQAARIWLAPVQFFATDRVGSDIPKAYPTDLIQSVRQVRANRSIAASPSVKPRRQPLVLSSPPPAAAPVKVPVAPKWENSKEAFKDLLIRFEVIKPDDSSAQSEIEKFNAQKNLLHVESPMGFHCAVVPNRSVILRALQRGDHLMQAAWIPGDGLVIYFIRHQQVIPYTFVQFNAEKITSADNFRRAEMNVRDFFDLRALSALIRQGLVIDPQNPDPVALKKLRSDSYIFQQRHPRVTIPGTGNFSFTPKEGFSLVLESLGVKIAKAKKYITVPTRYRMSYEWIDGYGPAIFLEHKNHAILAGLAKYRETVIAEDKKATYITSLRAATAEAARIEFVKSMAPQPLKTRAALTKNAIRDLAKHFVALPSDDVPAVAAFQQEIQKFNAENWILEQEEKVMLIKISDNKTIQFSGVGGLTPFRAKAEWIVGHGLVIFLTSDAETIGFDLVRARDQKPKDSKPLRVSAYLEVREATFIQARTKMHLIMRIRHWVSADFSDPAEVERQRSYLDAFNTLRLQVTTTKNGTIEFPPVPNYRLLFRHLKAEVINYQPMLWLTDAGHLFVSLLDGAQSIHFNLNRYIAVVGATAGRGIAVTRVKLEAAESIRYSFIRTLAAQAA